MGVAAQQFTTAHWALDKSWTYFRDVRGRNGWNGSGMKAKLRVWESESPVPLDPIILINGVPANSNPIAAFLGGNVNEMVVGKDAMALDVMAHEFSHGMNRFTAKLGNTGVWHSMSLNESFADIFGEMVERHATGNTNFRIGNQVPAAAIGVNFFRDLQNPALSIPTAQPSIFEGANWVFNPTNNINFSPHENGGVQNRWFTLLAIGGFQNGVNVSGIGSDKASRIAWGNLTTRLGEASNFMDARNGAVDVARATYGACSNELLQTIRAWRAVGLDGPLTNPAINGNSFVCWDDFSYFPMTINGCWFSGATFSWHFPPELNAIASGSDLQIQSINGSGTFTVTLTATFEGVTRTQDFTLFVTGCGGGQFLITPSNKHSIGKATIYPNPTTHYVNIDLPAVDIDKVYNLKVVNTLGQVAFSKKINYFDNKIDMSRLSDGFYNFIIQDDNGNIKYSSKIQKNRQ